ncbi:hypothetical protein AURDEDRAFT_165876 [Auricularia subglabra TFB-10046 SS5]|nr:hypothetical protein AURDEDRAFT_165876 [Auricularia subglabra TFB-10046 SS5]
MVALHDDEDLAAMVAACPALQTLIIGAPYDDIFLPNYAFDRLNDIPVVVLYNHVMLDEYARRRFLQLSWTMQEQTSSDDALSIINDFFDKFSVVFTFSSRTDELNIWCIDQRRTERLLSFWDTLPGLEESFPLWERLSPVSLLGLTIQPCLWRCVTRTLPEVAALTTLCFLVAHAHDLADISLAPWKERHPEPVFVSLTTLHLRAWSSTGPIHVGAAEVSRVVRALDLNLPLPLLVLHGVTLDDPSAVEGVTRITFSADLTLPFTPVIELPGDLDP